MVSQIQKIKEISAFILSRLSTYLVRYKRTTEQTLEIVKRELIKDLGMNELMATNFIRFSMAIYLGEKEYAQKSFNVILESIQIEED